MESGRPREVLHSKMKTLGNPHLYLFEMEDHVRPIGQHHRAGKTCQNRVV
jgi:hypothetical protein